MSTIKKLVALLAIFLAMNAAVMADVLKIDGGEAEVVVKDNRPSRGMNQLQVLELYGEPTQRNPVIGEPPISSWDYPGYSVFFEGDYVLHTVNHDQEKSTE